MIVLVTLVYPLSTDLDANLRGLGSFTKAVIGTHESALDERASSRCTPKSWQNCAIGASSRNLVTRWYDGPRSTCAIEVECRHHKSASWRANICLPV
jgi:hypothetical protein